MTNNPSFFARIPEVSVQRLIVSKATLKGDGVPKDPCRRVLTFYTLEGEEVAEFDPHEPSGRTEGMDERLLVDAPKDGPFHVKKDAVRGWIVTVKDGDIERVRCGLFNNRPQAQTLANRYNAVWREGYSAALNANP